MYVIATILLASCNQQVTVVDSRMPYRTLRIKLDGAAEDLLSRAQSSAMTSSGTFSVTYHAPSEKFTSRLTVECGHATIINALGTDIIDINAYRGDDSDNNQCEPLDNLLESIERDYSVGP